MALPVLRALEVAFVLRSPKPTPPDVTASDIKFWFIQNLQGRTSADMILWSGHVDGPVMRNLDTLKSHAVLITSSLQQRLPKLIPLTHPVDQSNRVQQPKQPTGFSARIVLRPPEARIGIYGKDIREWILQVLQAIEMEDISVLTPDGTQIINDAVSLMSLGISPEHVSIPLVLRPEFHLNDLTHHENLDVDELMADLDANELNVDGIQQAPYIPELIPNPLGHIQQPVQPPNQPLFLVPKDATGLLATVPESVVSGSVAAGTSLTAAVGSSQTAAGSSNEIEAVEELKSKFKPSREMLLNTLLSIEERVTESVEGHLTADSFAQAYVSQVLELTDSFKDSVMKVFNDLQPSSSVREGKRPRREP